MTAAQALIQQFTVRVDHCAPRLNSRDELDFEGKEFEALVESIREHGVIEPIVIKPASIVDGNASPWTYEIVCGERRWRGAEAAGLTEIPAVVRSAAMTDVEIIEMQLEENGRRADFHPLHEAKSYQHLAKAGLSTEEIAKKVKRGLRDVQVTMQLLHLVPKARAAFREGKFDKSRALLLARMPIEKLQLEMLKALEQRPGYTVKDDTEYFRREYMLELTKAPFNTKDPLLCPDAGACVGCPYNTATQPELFTDVAKSLCTNKPCYEKKTEASWKQTVEDRKAQGLKTLSDKETKAVFHESSYYGSEAQLKGDSGYVKADEACTDDPKRRDYRKLLGKSAKGAIVLARAPNGAEVELLAKGGLRQLLRDAEHDFWKEEKSSSSSKSKKNGASSNSSVSPAVKAKQEADEQLRVKMQRALVLEVLSALEGSVPLAIWREAALAMLGQAEDFVHERWSDEPNGYDASAIKEAEKWIAKATADQLRAFVLAAALEREFNQFSNDQRRRDFLKLLKIDAQAIKDKVKKTEATRIPVERFTTQLTGHGFKVGKPVKKVVTVECQKCDMHTWKVELLDDEHLDIADFDQIVDHQSVCFGAKGQKLAQTSSRPDPAINPNTGKKRRMQFEG